MSKLTKLVMNPKRFILDSAVVQKVAKFAPRSRHRMSLDLTPSTIPATNESVQNLVDALSCHVGVFDLSEPGNTEIAVLDEEKYLVSGFLFKLQGHEGAVLELQIGPRQLCLGASSLLDIDEFLGSSGSFRLTLTESNGRSVILRLQFWAHVGDKIIGPSHTHLARNISTRVVELHGIFQKGTRVHANVLNQCSVVLHPEFPIDVVYTWVNHKDPGWQALRASVSEIALEDETNDGRSIERFISRDELKFSLRSVRRYAPWVRCIFVVSNCAPPAWLNLNSENIKWISHETIIPASALPTFSSHAIESRLQHIPELSKHFIYFNDDFVLARPTAPSDFFYCNGISKAFMEPYGSVSGKPQEDEPDYLNAARNGKLLLERDFSKSVISLHRHTPYALRKDVLFEMEAKYSEIATTTQQRFRTIDDISTVSFFYHHYAYLTCRAIYTDCSSVLIKPLTERYEQKLKMLLETDNRPLAVCLNDGAGSNTVPHWGNHIVEFLEAFLPGPSDLERDYER